jgi:3-oxoadipate enol-lactonase
VRVRYRLDGQPEAPTLVLSNSLGTDLELWAPNLPAWTGRFRVLRYDQRGHGRSELPTEPYTVEELARDVLELLDRIEEERVSFCGLSLGGATGMWLAANAPDRIDRLVLACTSAHFGEPGPWLERARVVRSDGMDAIVDRQLDRWFTRGFAGERPEVVARCRRMLLSTPAEGYARGCEAVAAWDFRESLSAIRAPALVVAGEDDPATPPEHAGFLAERIAGAGLAVLPAAAHLANVQQPESFAELVTRHVAFQAVS